MNMYYYHLCLCVPKRITLVIKCSLIIIPCSKNQKYQSNVFVAYVFHFVCRAIKSISFLYKIFPKMMKNDKTVLIHTFLIKMTVLQNIVIMVNTNIILFFSFKRFWSPITTVLIWLKLNWWIQWILNLEEMIHNFWL